ncbi:HNH endonuclease [Synechococcus sp. PCC 7502]|uniref:HNH endonuclease n=1 Tax=Synechococcus sp. PCC 7502 TaxID=1173263 RepID=UPI00030A5087|nr:HNH endonuclease [Synechococcus sp. PCC 7502]
MDRKLYPTDWEQIAIAIKEAVDWKCEKCGKQYRRNGESWAEFFSEWDMQSSEFAEAIDHPQRFTLTVAQLDHVQSNCGGTHPEGNRSNLKALCKPCHLRYDVGQMATKKRLKKERHGQLTLEVTNGSS